jgi:hypothetical protein
MYRGVGSGCRCPEPDVGSGACESKIFLRISVAPGKNFDEAHSSGGSEARSLHLVFRKTFCSATACL